MTDDRSCKALATSYNFLQLVSHCAFVKSHLSLFVPLIWQLARRWLHGRWGWGRLQKGGRPNSPCLWIHLVGHPDKNDKKTRVDWVGTRWTSEICSEIQSEIDILRFREMDEDDGILVIKFSVLSGFSWPVTCLQRCPDEEFAAALEKQMKAEEGGLSRFGALAGALTKLSYHYHMVMPGYIILFIRTFLTLEGIAGVVPLGMQRFVQSDVRRFSCNMISISSWTPLPSPAWILKQALETVPFIFSNFVVQVAISCLSGMALFKTRRPFTSDRRSCSTCFMLGRLRLKT